MLPFLKAVAQGYVRRYRDLSKFCFVFPGRRSGTFFLKYMRECAGNRTLLAPRVVTITDLIDDICGLIPDNRIDLLMLLYNCYCEIVTEYYGNNANLPDFNSFWSWGDMILSDFNDVDTHLADPDSLFKNLADLNEIATDFLTDEQREVMTTYFNVTPPHKEVSDFWRNFKNGKNWDEPSENPRLRSRFLHLWQVLAPLYHRFNEKLASEGLSYSGSAARQALTIVERDGAFHDDETVKLVFVGFNVLTAVEWKLFKAFSCMTCTPAGVEEPFADFVWDMNGHPMKDKHNSAARYVRRGMKDFPKPDWLDLSATVSSGVPESIKVISAASNIEQAKLAALEVNNLNASTTQEDIDNAKIAVVLPDESLLIPMIYSIPRNIDSVNLTMGLPMRHTPVATYVSLLRHLQNRLRRDREPVFYYEDVEAILAHPLSMTLLGPTAVMEIKGNLYKSRRRFVTAHTLTNKHPESSILFHAVDADASPDASLDYVETILRRIDELHLFDSTEHIEENDRESTSISNLLHVHIEAYLAALQRLRRACHERNIDADFQTIFFMADRLIAGDKVLFEGDPLRGLQIMGLLETRSLDFEHLIIPSMNERIFPRRMHTRSFIPASLRVAFGLPTTQSQESIFAYYFYRLISRAKTLTLIYDARTGGLRSGDPSRYILQLKRLYAKGKVKTVASQFALHTHEKAPVSVVKNQRIMQRVSQYLQSGDSYLSASSLNKYMACPLDFYYSYIERVNVQDAPAEFMTAVDLGNVVHKAMMWIYMDHVDGKTKGYKPVTPHRLTKAFFDTLLADGNRTIDEVVRRAINSEYLKVPLDNKLSGEALIQSRLIADTVRDLLRIDAQFDSLEIISCEVPVKVPYVMHDGRTVQFTMTIDRVDKVTSHGRTRYRVVDYKTGSVSMNNESLDDLFAGKHSSKYPFQLMLYCHLMRVRKEIGDDEELEPVIYDVLRRRLVSPAVSRVCADGKSQTVTITSDTQVSTYRDGVVLDVAGEFADGLQRVLEELLNPEEPFSQCEDPSSCVYCNFRDLCRR